MGLRSWYKSLRAQPVTGMTRAAGEVKGVHGGRVSTDTANSMTFRSGFTVVPPTDYESFWRMRDLDTNNLDLYSPQQLLDMLIDLSPEVSLAVWQFQRLCNPGFEYKVYKPGNDKTEDPASKAHIDQLFTLLRNLHGSVDIVLGRYFLGAYLRGGFCGEIVLDDRAIETVDLVAPDPYSVRFRKRLDPVRGEVWEPGQFQIGKFVSLEIPTFRYLPVDPAPASPYGRSLAAPAIFTAIFSLSLMHDVKRVVMQQGYKRMDIKLNTENAMDVFGFDPGTYGSLGEYMRSAIEEVRAAYSALQPDDAFIHTDIFELDIPAGTVDSDSIGAIDKLIERLEKKLTHALKSNGVVMDTSDNSNETDSNRKWEIHAAGIKSLQHHCENMLESLFNLSLQAKGLQGQVQFRFSELRAAEMFRDEQTRQLRIMNGREEYQAGFISQDEASLKTVGHVAFAKEPLQVQAAVKNVQDNSSGNELIKKAALESNSKPAIVENNGYEKIHIN